MANQSSMQKARNLQFYLDEMNEKVRIGYPSDLLLKTKEFKKLPSSPIKTEIRKLIDNILLRILNENKLTDYQLKNVREIQRVLDTDPALLNLDENSVEYQIEHANMLGTPSNNRANSRHANSRSRNSRYGNGNGKRHGNSRKNYRPRPRPRAMSENRKSNRSRSRSR